MKQNIFLTDDDSANETPPIGVTDPLQVSVNDVVGVEIGEPMYNPHHLVCVKLDVHADMKNMDPYNRHTIGPGVLAYVLQESSVWHPRRYRTKRRDIGSCTESGDHIVVFQSLPYCDLLIVPLK